MDFIRHQQTKFYTLGTRKLLIYWKNNNGAGQFAFDNAFISDQNKNWVLFFYETDTDISQLNEDDILKVFDELGTHNAALIWADAFGNDLFSKSQKITLDKNIISGALLSFKQSNLATKHKFALNGIDASMIQVNGADDLFIKRNDGKEFQIKINESVANFKHFTIGLSNDVGCMKFTSQFTEEKSSLHLAIPYVSKKIFDNADPSEEPVVTANIFDKKNMVGCNMSAAYFPYNNSNNSSFKISTNSDLGIKTNFLDAKGNNLETNSLEEVEFTFSKVVLSEDAKRNRYILSPTKGKISTNKARALVGFSGTESLATEGEDVRIVIEFRKGNTFLVNEETIAIEEITTPSEAGYFVFDAETNYHFDSEKSPLFVNNSNGEISYAPIEMATHAANTALPFIPTLSFKDNYELQALEKVFSKIRQNEITKNDPSFRTAPVSFETKNYVTPQGFLRNGDTINLINPEGIVKFEISNVALNSDFHLSVSKDDVFFVLTPAMLSNPQVLQTVEVLFNLGDTKFQVALNDFKSVTAETFIIFKFSRHSFKDLLEDDLKWSNFGIFKPSNYDAVRDGIKKYSTFPDNENYRYFNDKILNSPKWDGIVILNIPIKDKGMPAIFKGLKASQAGPDDATGDADNTLKLQTQLKFQYVAFPVNRTKLSGGEHIEISNTSFYGIIDYDIVGGDKPVERSVDYPAVCSHFTNVKDDLKHKFLLSKLLVRFENSTIVHFKSFAFWQIPNIFENSVTFEIKDFPLSHAASNPVGEKRINLIRLEGNYQETDGGDEFNFNAQGNLKINFGEDNVLKDITIYKIGFTSPDDEKEFRFDLSASANANSWALSELISIESLDFQNIGFKFNLLSGKLPKLNFDTSKLLVLPKIKFDGNGFLSSFPVKFSYFQTFKLPKISLGDGKFDFGIPDWDFFKLKYDKPKVDWKEQDWKDFDFANLFSFVFDFDLGTLGDLGALKALKGQLLVGWSFNGGFALGFKLNGPSNDGLHLDLFGALKLDVKELNYGKFKPKDSDKCSAYFLRLVDARITIFGKQLPDSDHSFNGIIITDFSNPSKKVAWLINYNNQKSGDLILGMGQRMGPVLSTVTSTVTAIEQIKENETFKNSLENFDGCDDNAYKTLKFQPERNWLIASEAILPKDWPIELKFIFNDPVLYGMYLGFKGDILKGFTIDIIYKKLSESLGVYSTEIQLPDELRNQDLGGAFLKLPNIGVDIFTNGDWKVDIGFPRNSNDWSRSGFLQLRSAPPFVGFFGFYMMMSKTASLTLFKGVISDSYSTNKLQIIQAGFAMRTGIGFYFDKGILFLGASITLYGILEGAFAFEKKQDGLAQLFPDHFAVLGRVGVLAELIGYVNFGIIKASVYLSMRAEFGMLLIYIGDNHTESANGGYLSKGIQPVIVYIEGQVIVRVTIKIGCVKIRLSFNQTLRFEYTIGGSGNSGSSFMAFDENPLLLLTDTESLPIVTIAIEDLKEVPMMYLPAFSKVKEDGGESLKLLHTFMIPFFGKTTDGDHIKLSDRNIIKDRIIQPFFANLIDGLAAKEIIDANRYETLRSILVNGHAWKDIDGVKTMVKIDIRLDDYVPTLISGINSTDWKEVDQILKTHFLFGSEELKDLQDDNSINGKYREEHLVIPAPISKHIKIVDKDNTVLLEKQDGFNLKIEGLVDWFPVNGSEIKEIRAYDDGTLQWIEDFFDDYKTQFLDRRKNQTQAFAPEDNKDLRTEVIIPEFFKLLALLTLEALHNSKEKVKGEPEYNPEISVNADGNFILDGNPNPWETNKALPEIIGQVNYFYNSGLRLPFEDGKEETRSLYKILEQEETVQPIGVRDLSKVKVFIDEEEITNSIFENEDRKTEMLNFIDDFKAENGFALDKLRNEFGVAPIEFTRPFKLMPVKLAVQNGKLECKDEFRFFEIPGKLSRQNQSNTQYAFDVNYAEYKDDKVLFATNKPNVPDLKGIKKCLNVAVKVKKHRDNVVEIVDVFADDLNLMNALHKDSSMAALSAINFYFKPEADPNQPQQQIALTKLTTAHATILKTNLSPRTAPPIFDIDSRVAFDAEDLTEYWEDSNRNQSNFIRLVWEALTTNNGGYYLILDAPNVNSDGTIIISFESEMPKVPVYFNALKLNIQEDAANNKVILEQLENNSHYLFLDAIKLSNDEVSDKEVLEYHPAIPAHTLGFDVARDNSINTPNYNNYLPLEFTLSKTSGEIILSNDKVLPIMPTNEVQADGSALISKLRYNHLTPLVIQSDKKPDGTVDAIGRNTYRYKETGNKFKLGINLRDVFGNRAGQNNQYLATAEYTHLYFDKIIPVESWPLMQFSYWFKQYDSNSELLQFDISLISNFLEILDMAGIEKQNNSYKYSSGDEIEPNDVEKLKDIVPGLLSSFYTILAQLTDEKTTVKINGIETPAEKLKWQKMVLGLLDKLENLLLKDDDQKYHMPATIFDSASYTVGVHSNFKLKSELLIGINLSRNDTNCLMHTAPNAVFKSDQTQLSELVQPYIWDYELTHNATSSIRPLNLTDKAKSKLTDLNHEILAKTNNNFNLGISSEFKSTDGKTGSTNEKAIYIVNARNLRSIKADKQEFDKSCYFGIKPISKNLWSGNYVTVDGTLGNSFSNVDIDKSMRKVLEKIDDLLDAKKLSKEIYASDANLQQKVKDLYNRLLKGKRSIVNNELTNQLDWVENDSAVSVGQKQEFRDLLLHKLSNFYNYEGMVRTKLMATDVLQYNDPKTSEEKYHRLSVNLKSAKYNLVSSKIGDCGDEWVILFDQTDAETDISFDTLPEITHIEYDISNVPNSEDIQQSSWIQLLTPVVLDKYEVKKWRKIVREFPQKPIILKHLANQLFKDSDAAVENWDNGQSAGLWNYELEIKDNYISDNDIVVVDLAFETSTAAFANDKTDLKGFIAYWAAIFSEPEIDPIKFPSEVSLLEAFVKDMERFSTVAFAQSLLDQEGYTFELHKTGTEWSIVNSGSLNIEFPKNSTGIALKTNPSVVIGPLNIFSKTDRVLSILPKIKAIRNRIYNGQVIGNPAFVYETDTVQPESPASPHLEYHLPIRLEPGVHIASVFDQIAAAQLPYKSTAKFLIGTDELVTRKEMLPVIPVRQMEFLAGHTPAILVNGTPISIDDLFDSYTNGYASVSLTIYTDKGETELPIFVADNIYKPKQ
ncbi:hypothetical protein [Flavobacterium sp. FlaQc-48]|uniref:hypothetical protein n=1 Tax=Flavobacterium sp. FlaQc-48 TaxID=3374181 RepID=UPI003757B175